MYINNNVDAVIGLQYGDEGKGKITAGVLSQVNYDITARFNGGPNAGHSIHKENGAHYALHQLPSSVVYGQRGLIGPGSAVDFHKLNKEIKEVNAIEDLNVKNLLHVARNICPIKNRHIEVDRNFHAGMQGSTSSGIAPAYSDFYNRTNESNNQQYLPPPLTVDNMLLEGAQGFYLDIYHGQYPYVTSSHISPAFAAASFGFSPKKIRNIIGVAKCYETRSGKDPYFDYLMDDMGVLKKQKGFNFSFEDIYEDIQKTGHEFGVTTGRKRQIRFLDVSRLIHSINATGTTHVVINKWDILEKLDACCYFYNTNLFVCDKESMFPEVEALIYAYCKDVKKVFYSASKTNDIDWKWLND
jgi:adenylosuccinate synthase